MSEDDAIAILVSASICHGAMVSFQCRPRDEDVERVAATPIQLFESAMEVVEAVNDARRRASGEHPFYHIIETPFYRRIRAWALEQKKRKEGAL